MHPFSQAAMYDQIQSCDLCRELHNNGKKVLGYGNFKESRIMIVGEAPGREEAESGTPFIGQAGQTLRRLIKEAGMDWDHIYITNAVKCRPPNNRDPEQREIEDCRGYLAAQIFGLRPAMIMAAGRVSMEAIVNTGMKITKAAGTFHKLYANTLPMDIQRYEGWAKEQFFIDTNKGLLSIVMPILHPQHINYNGGVGSELYNKTLEKLKMVWKDYVDQKGWWSLADDIPF